MGGSVCMQCYFYSNNSNEFSDLYAPNLKKLRGHIGLGLSVQCSAVSECSQSVCDA